jgi:hypothetical protein
VRLELWSRRLLAVAGVLLTFTGLMFFLVPEYAAENFPWAVSPLVAMTIGGWTLGLGLATLETVRDWALPRVYATLLAAWSFSILEMLVVVAFAERLRTDHLLTWPYVGALILGALSGAFGLPVAWRRRAELGSRSADQSSRGLRAVFGGFGVLVLGLAAAVLVFDTATPRVFPEPLSPFTAGAFAAFLASLGVGALPLLLARDAQPAIHYTRNGLYLIVLITVAALSYLHVFDFSARPGQLIYIGAYVVTGAVAVALLIWHRQASGGPRWRP